ncbi:MAG: caspase family protein, partial [Sphingobacteriales bacterium]
DHYRARGWDALKNPVYDATEVAEVLQNDYGFTTTLLKDPPLDSIYAALIRYYRTLQPKDQLLIYFAGHGDFDEQLMDDGFIVCSDSKPVDEDPVRNSYLQHSRLKKMINKIPARQTLVVLDICHGGSFDDGVLGKREGNNSNISNRNVLQFLRDKAQYQTRLFLSSVGKESAFDGRAGKHSPFANLLLQILRARGEGTNGIITLSDIYAVLQKQSLNETESLRIAPYKAGFGSNDALSEFILIPVEKNGN